MLECVSYEKTSVLLFVLCLEGNDAIKGTKQTGVIMPEDPNANEDSEVFQIATQCIKSLLQQPSVSRFHPCLFCLKETSVKTQSHRVTRLLLLTFFSLLI